MQYTITLADGRKLTGLGKNGDNFVSSEKVDETIFPAYAVGTAYKAKEVFSYGLNSVGDPQLYQVLQDHTSSAEWTPDTATSLYKKIGVAESGYPEWVQPLGASDAYNTGDIVSYKDALYRSLMDGNVWNPEQYSAGWELYTE